MTLDELIKKLRKIRRDQQKKKGLIMKDPHEEADEALLDYINDARVTRAYDRIEKYYE